MARINFEECWWSDLRRSKLSKLLGSEFLADGAAVRMWRLAQDFWKDGRRLVPVQIWDHFDFGKECVEAGLAVNDGEFIYVRGSSEYLEWAAEQRANAKKAGEKSAEARKKKSGTAQPKGGKGSKNPNANRTTPEREPNGTEPSGSGSVSVSVSGSGSGSVSDSSSDSGKCTSYEQKTKSFIAGYCERFKFKYGTNPEMQGKPAGLAKTIAKGLSEEKMELYLDAFFAMPDARLVKEKHPLALFQLKLNEIVVFANTGNFTTQRQALQADDMASNQLLLEKIRRAGA